MAFLKQKLKTLMKKGWGVEIRTPKQDMNFKTTQDIFVLLCWLLELDTSETSSK